SFFVPAFRLKQDVVPGKPVSLWFEPTREGVYHLFCAEFCGTKHSEMNGTIVALAPEAYAEWLASGDSGYTAIDHGRQLFLRHGCSGCHAPASPVRAPMLEGIFGRQVPLDNQAFVLADDRYIRDSILQPQREIAAGYEPVMPSYDGVISENDLLDLIAYIKSLRDEPAPVVTPQPLPPNLP
ncbi:MAG: c-type cytochrome, partial [Opitutaceae bacterium]